MPTQPGGYRTKDGKRVPSVTTITGRFKESDGLIYWANRLALDPLLQARAIWLAGSPDLGVALSDTLGQNPDLWDHKKASQLAADAGTVAHEIVDGWIKLGPQSLGPACEFCSGKYGKELVEMAAPAVAAFLEWANQSSLKIVETEKPLVSEQYRFGGTRDAIMVSGKRAIGDWKTSNAIYPEYLCQLAAYGILDEEAGNTIDGGFHLIRFSKQKNPGDPVQFSHHYWSHLDGPRKAFLLMRELYDVLGQIKDLAK